MVQREAGTDRLRISGKADAVAAMYFVGYAHETEKKVGWMVTKPTPFQRAVLAALAKGNDAEKARALIGLAARLCGGIIKETILENARRFAVAAGDNELRNLASSQSADREAIPLAPEPDCLEGLYRGRFVVLGDGAVAQVPAALLPAGSGWLSVWKRVHFAAEVEVAPGLLRLSLTEALAHDANSPAAWRTWLGSNLRDNDGLRERLLALLPPAA
jgi:hypothetical protein